MELQIPTHCCNQVLAYIFILMGILCVSGVFLKSMTFLVEFQFHISVFYEVLLKVGVVASLPHAATAMRMKDEDSGEQAGKKESFKAF